MPRVCGPRDVIPHWVDLRAYDISSAGRDIAPRSSRGYWTLLEAVIRQDRVDFDAPPIPRPGPDAHVPF